MEPGKDASGITFQRFFFNDLFFQKQSRITIKIFDAAEFIKCP